MSPPRHPRRPRRETRPAPPLAPAYITRRIPHYALLDEESLVRIENQAFRLLEQVGIEFRDDPIALEHWKRAGAKVDGVLVKFEPGLLREILNSLRFRHLVAVYVGMVTCGFGGFLRNYSTGYAERKYAPLGATLFFFSLVFVWLVIRDAYKRRSE